MAKKLNVYEIYGLQSDIMIDDMELLEENEQNNNELLDIARLNND